jgi:HK97 family phage major capsid protein
VDTLLTTVVAEREQKVNLIKNYAEAAHTEGRDLTESEQDTMGKARSRIGELDKQVALLADDLEMASDVRDKLRQVSISVGLEEPGYRRGGELLFDVLHQSEETSRLRLGRAMKRAAEHMGTDAAKTVPVAGDLGGLVVIPVSGAVIDVYPKGMPFASALGLTTSPDAMHFMRPRIDDPNFLSSSGPQGTGGTAGFEKAELPSKKFDVTADPVALAVIGEYLNISQQLLSFQPAALDLITSHMLRRLGYAVDRSILTEMIKSTGKVVLAATASAAEVLQAVYDASAAVYASTGDLASWIVMGPKGYARLGGLTDLAGRPLFPTLGAANAPGTASAAQFVGSVAGLAVVVTPAIADETMWVGNALVIEGYIYRFPVLEAVEPSVLGRQVAVAAAVAGYRPVPNGAVLLAP